jgi:hypothetical protein
VEVGELVVGVSIALGAYLPEICPNIDVDAAHGVTIDELLLATGNAMEGCLRSAARTRRDSVLH